MGPERRHSCRLRALGVGLRVGSAVFMGRRWPVRPREAGRNAGAPNYPRFRAAHLIVCGAACGAKADRCRFSPVSLRSAGQRCMVTCMAAVPAWWQIVPAAPPAGAGPQDDFA